MTCFRQNLSQIQKDLKKKMVFIAGPRQVGKTTLAHQLQNDYSSSAYYNWDYDEDKEKIRKSQLDYNAEFWIFDEIHKFQRWRNWLKGNYDVHHHEHQILVTGSAKLDLYNRGGDSLQGRYFLHRLHPYTVAELSGINFHGDLNAITELPVTSNTSAALEQLLQFGGFPEPLFGASVADANRWRVNYGYRLIREDIKDLENIILLDKMQDLYDHLPNTVGSSLSINSLREDLEVNFNTVKKWLEIFDKNYASFRLNPYGPPKIRAVKKESKLYLWDWARVESTAARLENLVALHLLRFCNWAYDIQGEILELRYFRDLRGTEVDFIILRNKKPWMAIEVKESEQNLDSNLRYLLERVAIPYAYQIHLNGNLDRRETKINQSEIRIMPAWKFLGNLA